MLYKTTIYILSIILIISLTFVVLKLAQENYIQPKNFKNNLIQSFLSLDSRLNSTQYPTFFENIVKNNSYDVILTSSNLNFPVYSFLTKAEGNQNNFTIFKYKKKQLFVYEELEFYNATSKNIPYDELKKIVATNILENNPYPARSNDDSNQKYILIDKALTKDEINKNIDLFNKNKVPKDYYTNFFTNPELIDGKIEVNSVEYYIRIQQRLQDITFQKRVGKLLPTNYNVDYTQYNNSKLKIEAWKSGISTDSLSKFNTQMNIFYEKHPDYKITLIQNQEEWDKNK